MIQNKSSSLTEKAERVTYKELTLEKNTDENLETPASSAVEVTSQSKRKKITRGFWKSIIETLIFLIFCIIMYFDTSDISGSLYIIVPLLIPWIIWILGCWLSSMYPLKKLGTKFLYAVELTAKVVDVVKVESEQTNYFIICEYEFENQKYRFKSNMPMSTEPQQGQVYNIWICPDEPDFFVEFGKIFSISGGLEIICKILGILGFACEILLILLF